MPDPTDNRPTIEIVGPEPQRAPCDGVVSVIPSGYRLLVNGAPQDLPATVSTGAELRVVLIDPVVAAVKAASSAAVESVIQQQRRPVYMDTTVQPPRPRTAPPPPDLTVSRQPVHIRLGQMTQAPAQPLPSPLKVATVADGAPLADGVLGEDDAMDLAVNIGGGETVADVEHARRQAKG